MGTEVANQSNSCLQHSSTLEHGYVGLAETCAGGGRVRKASLSEQHAFSEPVVVVVVSIHLYYNLP